MLLYTRQPADFNIVRDEVDLTKSSFYNDSSLDGFKKAYDFLFNMLGWSKWIWCHSYPYFSDTRYKKKEYPTERLWVLEVPNKHIICINRNMWDYVVSDWKWFGSDHFYNYVNELGISEEWIDKLDQAVEELPKEETWKKLIRGKNEWKEEDDYLIKSPISKRWVIGVYNLQEVDLKKI